MKSEKVVRINIYFVIISLKGSHACERILEIISMAAMKGEMVSCSLPNGF